MIISLDYDNTYTKDRLLWNHFIERANMHGHRVICITLRFPHEIIDDFPGEIIYTSRTAKLKYAANKGLYVDIWIDDLPHFIIESAVT